MSPDRCGLTTNKTFLFFIHSFLFKFIYSFGKSFRRLEYKYIKEAFAFLELVSSDQAFSDHSGDRITY